LRHSVETSDKPDRLTGLRTLQYYTQQSTTVYKLSSVSNVDDDDDDDEGCGD